MWHLSQQTHQLEFRHRWEKGAELYDARPKQKSPVAVLCAQTKNKVQDLGFIYSTVQPHGTRTAPHLSQKLGFKMTKKGEKMEILLFRNREKTQIFKSVPALPLSMRPLCFLFFQVCPTFPTSYSHFSNVIPTFLLCFLCVLLFYFVFLFSPNLFLFFSFFHFANLFLLLSYFL